jgi:tripartite-type tricarboxylate transporter receptor subunit TctC
VAGFDPGKDLTPIANLINAPQLMVVRSSFPATTFAGFLKYAKAHPGKVNDASSGNGRALTDLLGSTVGFTITTPPPLLAHIKVGKLRALMVAGRTRVAALPDVPTATEQGVPLVA